MQRVLTADSIKQRLGELAIGFAADCDEPDGNIDILIHDNLPNASTLPFVAFLTPDGQWVCGASGYQEIDAMRALLDQAAASTLMDAKPEVRKALEKHAAAAAAALAKSDWKLVLAAAREAKKSTGRCPERKTIVEAERKARAWAVAEFESIVQAANAGGELVSLRKRLTAMKAPFAGEPEALDCDAGLKALQRLQVVREVEAGGNPAKNLRPRSAEPFKGTRWTALFEPPVAPSTGK